MKSGKQRRKEQTARRIGKRGAASTKARQMRREGEAPVNESLLAPDNSYSIPDFVERGYYEDKPFTCKDCGTAEIWRSTQQKWWYEVAKGSVWTTAVRCRNCRRKERERVREARRVHLEGVARRASRPRPPVGQEQAARMGETSRLETRARSTPQKGRNR